MKVISQQLRLSATDLSNHLACHHLSVLDLSVARGARKFLEWKSPDLEIIRQLGMEHELAYLRYLEKLDFKVRDLRAMGNEEEAIVETVKLMKQGTDIIAQGALAKGRWFPVPASKSTHRAIVRNGFAKSRKLAYTAGLNSNTNNSTR